MAEMSDMASKKFALLVPEESHLLRVDLFVTGALEIDVSRSQIQKLIHGGNIRANGREIKPNYKVKTDDEIEVEFPEPEPLNLLPLDMPLSIVFQDRDIAVINKDPGVVVHPGPGNWERTLVNALLFHLRDLSQIGGMVRPGIVHRLDKDTSGLMVVAKNDDAHRSLVEQFAERRVVKEYRAIIVGKPPKDKDTISASIGRHRVYRHKMTVTGDGKEAVTDYAVEKVWSVPQGTFALLRLGLHTGRTHQIRVHLSSIGHPIVGDPIYSKKWEKYKVPFLLLASTRLEFDHPRSGERLRFQADMPEHMKEFMGRVESV